MTLQGITLYYHHEYRVDYSHVDNRLYIYKENEKGYAVYLGNRHIKDIIDIVEQNRKEDKSPYEEYL